MSGSAYFGGLGEFCVCTCLKVLGNSVMMYNGIFSTVWVDMADLYGLGHRFYSLRKCLKLPNSHKTYRILKRQNNPNSHRAL